MSSEDESPDEEGVPTEERLTWLEGEITQWTREDIISEAQATQLRSRYDREEPASREDRLPASRLVTVVALMGALLVGAGILVFLASVWGQLHQHLRATLVVGATLVFFLAGYGTRYRYRRPTVGHALFGVGAIGIGVSAFMLREIYLLDINTAWLFLSWFALALPIAHLVRSKPIGLLGLGALATWVFLTAEEPLAVGFFGVIMFVIGLGVRRWGDRPLATSYELAGILAVIGVSLFLLLVDVPLDAVTIELRSILSVVAALALIAIGFVVGGRPLLRASGGELIWTLVGGAIMFATLGVAAVAPDVLPEFVRVLLWHLLVLGLLLATVWLGYVRRSRLLVNLAVVAFLAQVILVLFSTVLDVLPGSIALITAGLLLLGVAIALERGRRELLEKMRRPGE